jgi:hypothetical protein
MMSKGARGMAALHRQSVYIVGVVYFERPYRHGDHLISAHDTTPLFLRPRAALPALARFLTLTHCLERKR